eukprot:236942-Hanusia_phi.AAC.5
MQQRGRWGRGGGREERRRQGGGKGGERGGAEGGSGLGGGGANPSKAIVREWTSRLPPPSTNEPVRGDMGIARKLPPPSGGSQQLGFRWTCSSTSLLRSFPCLDSLPSPSDGPAIVVLAVIGAHFQESLDDTTAARVTDGLIRALSSANLLHAKVGEGRESLLLITAAQVASHLLARGAQLWCR